MFYCSSHCYFEFLFWCDFYEGNEGRVALSSGVLEKMDFLPTFRANLEKQSETPVKLQFIYSMKQKRIDLLFHYGTNHDIKLMVTFESGTPYNTHRCDERFLI